jgi:hypothetical protein
MLKSYMYKDIVGHLLLLLEACPCTCFLLGDLSRNNGDFFLVLGAMQQVWYARDSIGEAITTNTAIPSPRISMSDPWRPPLSRSNPNTPIEPRRPSYTRHSRQHSRSYSESYPHEVYGHERTYTGGHSRRTSESYGLLQEPSNVHDYMTTIPLRFDQPPLREKRKIPIWAGVPQTLTRGRKENVKRTIGDILSIIITVPFFVTVSRVMAAHGKPAPPALYNQLNQLTKVVSGHLLHETYQGEGYTNSP